MSSILTLTLNPTVDITWELDRLRPEGKNRVRPRSLLGGGGGINVVRGVTELGGEALAIHTAGGEIGRRLGRLLDEEGLPHLPVDIVHETREAFILLVSEASDSYHVVPPGPRVTEEEGDRCLQVLLDRVETGSYVVLSGSLPEGLSPDLYGRIAREAREAGAHVVLDTSGPALRAALDVGVSLVKPNKREAAELIGRPVDDFDDAREANERFLLDEAAEVAVTTLGERGALCSTGAGHHEIHNPPLPREALSDAGAGDSLVAGIVSRLAQGADPVDACAMGVAAGSASIMTPGTELFRRTDVDDLRPEVEIRS